VPIGFNRLDTITQEVVDVPHCAIAMDVINHALPEQRARARAKMERKEYKADAQLLLRAHASAPDQVGDTLADDAKQTINEYVHGRRYQFLAQDFWQNNPFILPALVEHVLAEAKRHHATNLVDTYCGSGLFAIAAAASFDRVWGVEVSSTMADAASHNAQLNNITNASFLKATSDRIFRHLENGVDPQATTVVIDPPRKGCSPEFLLQLLRFKPKTVVYVSCHPASQARDLALLVQGQSAMGEEEGAYKVDRCTPFDLFPQTKHCECVVTLSLRE
jgi:23S rRNA (uracil1939-C5)-methyltransferase/tRNA (uracil-5-)-methyltransferase